MYWQNQKRYVDSAYVGKCYLLPHRRSNDTSQYCAQTFSRAELNAFNNLKWKVRITHFTLPIQLVMLIKNLEYVALHSALFCC